MFNEYTTKRLHNQCFILWTRNILLWCLLSENKNHYKSYDSLHSLIYYSPIVVVLFISFVLIKSGDFELAEQIFSNTDVMDIQYTRDHTHECNYNSIFAAFCCCFSAVTKKMVSVLVERETNNSNNVKKNERKKCQNK